MSTLWLKEVVNELQLGNNTYFRMWMLYKISNVVINLSSNVKMSIKNRYAGYYAILDNLVVYLFVNGIAFS